MKAIFEDLTSRIMGRIPGEEALIGDHAFSNSAITDLGSNTHRELLWEACAAHNLAVTNIWFEHITYSRGVFSNSSLWHVTINNT